LPFARLARKTQLQEKHILQKPHPPKNQRVSPTIIQKNQLQSKQISDPLAGSAFPLKHTIQQIPWRPLPFARLARKTQLQEKHTARKTRIKKNTPSNQTLSALCPSRP